jgi:GT2 family glycosyltransferase
MAQSAGAAPAATERFTVVIPVWHGADVISDCLQALFAHSGGRLQAVVAVDNASPDDSAALIEQRFPAVRLLRSSFNLGFAGGVNLGLQTAFATDAPEASSAVSDAVVLLNQDCIVLAGWLDAFAAALTADPQAGIAGCTVRNADNTLNHTGARLVPPLAYSEHLTTPAVAPQRVEYVTGAAFAIRRRAWDDIGPFDADFYPAYYEEVDYCYRACRRRWHVLYVPDAEVRHLQSGVAWRKDPLLHWTQQHRSRYRFAAKHYAGAELGAFLDAEAVALAAEQWFDQMLSRALAARATLRNLDATLQARRQDLDVPTDLADKRRLQVQLGDLAQAAIAAAMKFAEDELAERIGKYHAEVRAAAQANHAAEIAARNPLQRLYARAGLLPEPPAPPDTRDIPGEIRQAAQLHVLSLLAQYDYR